MALDDGTPSSECEREIPLERDAPRELTFRGSSDPSPDRVGGGGAARGRRLARERQSCGGVWATPTVWVRATYPAPRSLTPGCLSSSNADTFGRASRPSARSPGVRLRRSFWTRVSRWTVGSAPEDHCQAPPGVGRDISHDAGLFLSNVAGSVGASIQEGQSTRISSSKPITQWNRCPLSSVASACVHSTVPQDCLTVYCFVFRTVLFNFLPNFLYFFFFLTQSSLPIPVKFRLSQLWRALDATLLCQRTRAAHCNQLAAFGVLLSCLRDSDKRLFYDSLSLGPSALFCHGLD